MFKYKKFLILSLILIVLPFLGAGCTKTVSPEVQKASRPVVLNWWSPFSDSGQVRPIIDAYRVIHSNVTINFRKIRFEDYESEVLNALAEDRGPDVLSLHNDWLAGWQTKLLSMPKTTTLPFQEISGAIQKEVVTVLRANQTTGIKGVRSAFVDAVAGDVILPSEDTTGMDQVYGLPLALDTLALYYNKDLLNLAGIPSPPKTWNELQGLVKKLTKFDTEGKMVQSGAALGTARNVERAADILALLMMQNGAVMVNEAGQPAFGSMPAGIKGRSMPPGEEALAFYTDFANPAKESYAWNEQMPNSLQAFAAGKTAFFFGYSYHRPLLENLAPKLNFDVAAMPQIEGNPEINLANYWVEAVSRKTNYPDFAWDFVQFAASPTQAGQYLSLTKKPTALRALVNAQTQDLEIGVFASQVLRAKTWYHGLKPAAAEEAFLSMIETVNRGEATAKEAIFLAAKKILQTLR